MKFLFQPGMGTAPTVPEGWPCERQCEGCKAPIMRQNPTHRFCKACAEIRQKAKRKKK